MQENEAIETEIPAVSHTTKIEKQEQEITRLSESTEPIPEIVQDQEKILIREEIIKTEEPAVNQDYIQQERPL